MKSTYNCTYFGQLDLCGDSILCDTLGNQRALKQLGMIYTKYLRYDWRYQGPEEVKQLKI